MGKFDARISRRGQRGVYSSAFRPPCVLFLRVLVVVALVLAAPHLAFASGEERTTVGDDLLIRTDTRWAGGTLGGYLPVRVEISNQAPARTLVLEVTPSDRTHGATVKRVVGVDQHATVRFTLSIPLTAFRQGLLRVYDQRGELESHVRLIGGAALLGRRDGACNARGLVPAGRLYGLHQGGRRLARQRCASARCPRLRRPRLRKWFRPTACPIRGLITADSISSPFRATTWRTSSPRRDRPS